MAIPQYSSGLAKFIAGLTSYNHLVQFLMGLNDAFDHIRYQILVMDLLPTVSEAYSMILRVGNQYEVHVAFGESSKSSAFYLLLMKINEGNEIIKEISGEKTMVRNVKGIHIIAMLMSMSVVYV